MSWHEYDIYSKTYTEGSLFYNECPGIFTRTIVLIQGSGGTDPGEYVAVNMSLRVKSWCDILRAE